MNKIQISVLTLLVSAMASVHAAENAVQVPMRMIDVYGDTKDVGTITITETSYGALLTPNLHDLVPGAHGFHVHEKPSCKADMKDGYMQAGLAAGGHLDPQGTGKHEGPYGAGHLGDLPPLFVTADGKATVPVLAPRLKAADLKGHSLMIHMGGDNYADAPKKLGGGGMRMACGVIH